MERILTLLKILYQISICFIRRRDVVHNVSTLCFVFFFYSFNSVLKFLFLLKDPYVIHLHCGGQGGFVDALVAAPVAAPSKVQDDVVGLVVGVILYRAVGSV